MKTVIERFEEKYIPVTESGCWLWIGAHKEEGYGNFKAGEGYANVAHRFSYQYYKGVIPEGMCVCHSCDEPSCVNPEHLFLGTINDNNQDKVAKDRQARGDAVARFGEDHPKSKLTESDVKYIRSLPMSRKELAKLFDVSYECVRDIVNRKRWSHVA